jgi:glyoxylase-like metal-dependent hydrolase (beta-lactamase superfamily II)
VLTHHHSDHAGGIRPFVAAGATFIAAPQTLPVIERTVTARVSLNPDALSGREELVRSEPVGAEKRIADAGNEMRVINVGANPHVEGMLVVWLPRQKLLFQSDLFTPAPLERFPDRARIPVMRWFVDWLDASALVPDQIRSMHGNGAVTPQQLDIIRTMPVDEIPAQDRD